mmetsp:Transcript_20120/g.43683  ORF Transcript_20120/g.43683 Transcript_20120/m.43683 type:complete len:386 (-) Transcript_20120:139-1296(-)|eukprot:CAMPEP_0172313592 /NCGR_PEP_ID=MMETSP1058-20130122/20545_1 /TAXON_ID=83371 /ORGANISM="Detonula confervacea, Strain CCMP 353" /LENGTH=385 /DNA_ID=CAMNT_0013027269 /DNA_START=82 /DNA_END=1239 /DNA_ORIENTATION=-
MFSPRVTIVAFLMAAAISANVHVRTADAFAFVPTATASTRQSISGGSVLLHSEKSSATTSSIEIPHGVTINDKIILRDPTPEERGKGGVEVASGSGINIKALEVLARINRDLIVTSVDTPDRAMEAISTGRNLTWATDLTAATLAALHPTEEEIAASSASDVVQAKKEWIQSWQTGGWGTSRADLGPEIAGDVLGCLLAMGSDNDKNVFAKFRMPCHPVLLKASMGLEVLTKCTEDEARDALTARGFTYRSMRDALQTLVLESTERPKGTVRDKRCWDVADTFSRVLSRATTLQLEGNEDGDSVTIAHAIVPLHERLAHSLNENTKLVSIGNEILLVATRDIAEGEPITRDYTSAPRMVNDESPEGSALHLLLQFGLPPNSWPQN